MKFSSVIGHHATKQKLKEMVNHDRIPHALLFCAQNGTGGLPMALATIAYLFCENRGDDSCGQCASCAKTFKKVHPDVNYVFPLPSSSASGKRSIAEEHYETWRRFLDDDVYGNLDQWNEKLQVGNKQSIINVAQAAEISQTLGLKSFEGKYKVMLIWLPELMNISASNKLLKLLEEPPDFSIFILVTEAPDSIIPTVLSRTQQISIPPIRIEDLAEALSKTLQIEYNAALEASIMSDGSYTEALKLLQEQEGEVLLRDMFIKWMRIMLKRQIPDLIDFSDQVSNFGREWQKNLLRFGLHIFREVLMVNLNQTELVRSVGDELDFIKKFSPFVAEQGLHTIHDALSEAIYEIERNGNPKLVFTDLSLRLVKVIKRG